MPHAPRAHFRERVRIEMLGLAEFERLSLTDRFWPDTYGDVRRFLAYTLISGDSPAMDRAIEHVASTIGDVLGGMSELFWRYNSREDLTVEEMARVGDEDLIRSMRSTVRFMRRLKRRQAEEHKELLEQAEPFMVHQEIEDVRLRALRDTLSPRPGHDTLAPGEAADVLNDYAVMRNWESAPVSDSDAALLARVANLSAGSKDLFARSSPLMATFDEGSDAIDTLLVGPDSIATIANEARTIIATRTPARPGSAHDGTRPKNDCRHMHTTWHAISSAKDETEDTLSLDCTACDLSGIARVAAHRAPDDFAAYRHVRDADVAAYLRADNLHRELRGDPPSPAGTTIDYLAEKDGIADLDALATEAFRVWRGPKATSSQRRQTISQAMRRHS